MLLFKAFKSKWLLLPKEIKLNFKKPKNLHPLSALCFFEPHLIHLSMENEIESMKTFVFDRIKKYSFFHNGTREFCTPKIFN